MELQDLQSIFNERIFRVPDYQRGYSWGEKQLNDLWRDISNLEGEKIHYTGLLSVDPQEKTGEIHVVDGQQRLTTLIILIHVICNCEQLKSMEWVNGKEKTEYVKRYLHRKAGKSGEVTEMIFGYEKDNPSHIHFKTKILDLDDTEKVPDHTLYTNNLDFAKKFFEKKVEKLKFDQIETVINKITKQLQFLYYPLDDRLNQFITFETLNYRGKDLTKLELLKNRLMYLSTELPNSDELAKERLRNHINNAWKTVYEYLGKNPEKPLDDDAFLMDHWIMYFNKYDRSASKVFANFLLDEHFILDNINCGSIGRKDILNYVLDIQKVVQAWYYLHNPNESKYSDEIKTWLGKLNRLRFRSFRPLIASILANKVEESKIIHVLKLAEKFNFVVLGLNMNGNNANFKTVPIYRRTYRSHKSPKKFDPEIFSLNALSVPDSTFTFTRDKLYNKVWESGNGFYDWRVLRYFLYEYELYLQKKSGNKENKLHWDQVNSETVEHIYPQNPDRKCWPKFRNRKAKDHLHELGNLLLFPRAKNSKLGNRSFEKKQIEYRVGGYSAIDVAKEEDWTPDSIDARQEKMLDFLGDRWGLRPPKTEEK